MFSRRQVLIGVEGTVMLPTKASAHNSGESLPLDARFQPQLVGYEKNYDPVYK